MSQLHGESYSTIVQSKVYICFSSIAVLVSIVPETSSNKRETESKREKTNSNFTQSVETLRKSILKSIVVLVFGRFIGHYCSKKNKSYISSPIIDQSWKISVTQFESFFVVFFLHFFFGEKIHRSYESKIKQLVIYSEIKKKSILHIRESFHRALKNHIFVRYFATAVVSIVLRFEHNLWNYHHQRKWKY